MALFELLRNTRKQKNDATSYYTHVSLVKPRGRFQIEQEELELFWTAYNLARQTNVPIGMAEVTQQYTGAVFDIDLSREVPADEPCSLVPLYMPEDVESTLTCITNTLRADLQVANEHVLTAVVLEKAGYMSGTRYKNGYHIQYPFLFVEKKWFGEVLLPKLAAQIVGLDKGVAKVAWLMYGSVKTETSTPYRITEVYNGELKKVTMESLRVYPLFNSFGHRIAVEGPIDDYLPRILSVLPMHRKITKVVDEPYVFSPRHDLSDQMELGIFPDENTCQSDSENMTIATRLLQMLAPHRAEDRNTWLRVGWILYYHSRGSNQGLSLWCKFSRKCPDKYCEATCKSEWQHMQIRYGLTIGTLFYWAQEDSPKECLAYKQERREATLSSYVASSHYGIAKYLKQMYGHEFICVNIRSNIWYQCVRGLWVKLSDPYTLRARLSEEVARDFNELQNNIIVQMNRNIQTTNTTLEMQQDAVKNLVANLRKRPFKMFVISEAADLFYEPEFVEKLNSNPYLIGFQNGVYDLKSCVFRNFMPEDHISKRLPIEYVQFAATHPTYLRLVDFFTKIFPDVDTRRYFFDIYSEIFVGGNHLKQIYFWTGFGDNGKTVTQALFERMLGSHAIKVPTTLFTGKKTATGAAAPELARAAPPVRLIVADEPDAKEELNSGYLKLLSGNDKYFARDLYQAGADALEVQPLFKITFICNRLPKIKDADEAVFNRIRVIPFESTFKPKAQCPPTEELQAARRIFPRNPRIVEEFDGMAVAFAFYLLEWRANKKNTIVTEPLKVMATTTRYRERNDVYFQFLHEMLVEIGRADPRYALLKTPSMTDREIFELFKLWFSSHSKWGNIPDYLEFVHYLEYRWSDDRDTWPHVSQVDENEQIASGSMVIL